MQPPSGDTAARHPVPAGGVYQRVREVLRRLGGGHGTGDVFRHMLVLAAGAGAAKAFAALSVPIITRLYTPEQYGLFALFLSAVALLAPLASLRYAAALPLPRRDRTAVALLGTCVLLLVLFLALLALLLATFADGLFALFSAQALAPIWPLLLIAIGTAGLHEILTSWSVRRGRFRAIAHGEVSQSLLGGLLKIGLALAALQRIGLYAGHIAGQAAACALLARDAWREARRPAHRAPGRVMRLAAARYADFPRYRLPSQLLMTFSQQAPILFVSACYGAATTGQLGLALMALALPVMLIGQTTGQAYYAEIARIGSADPERIQRITREVTVRLLVLGLAPTLVLMLAGERLFSLVFGAGWRDAGAFASILAIYLLAQFVANPLAHALSVFDRQRLFLRLNAVRAALTVAAFAIAYRLDLPATTAIEAYSVVLSIHYAAISVAIFAVIRRAVADRRNALAARTPPR